MPKLIKCQIFSSVTLQCKCNALTVHLQIHSLALAACLVNGHAQVMARVGQLGGVDMERAVLSKTIPVQVRELAINNPAELNDVNLLRV